MKMIMIILSLSLYSISISILLHYIHCYIVFFFPEMSRRLEREREI